MANKQPSSILAHPFRPFFLSVGIYGTLVILAWVAFLLGGWPLPLGSSPLQWHSHEMLYALVPAAIAGFVLTAMTNWTGAQPLRGLGLGALVLLWVAGRVVMWLAGWLPAWLVAAVDLSFLLVLAIYVAAILLRHNNHRNLVLVVVLALLFGGNALMHAGFLTGRTQLLTTGQLLAFDLITFLMVLIAGRITPAFSANWLRQRGANPAWVRTFPWLDRAALSSVALLLILDAFSADASVIGLVALVAAVANGLRLAAWSGWRLATEPLLWILHLAYLWIVAGLLLRGAGVFVPGIPGTVWQHAIGLGAVATLILGVMTRVALGHTGRPLQLPRFALVIYLAIIAATVLRLLTAGGLLNFRLGVSLSALCWVVAFGCFVVIYLPILTSPRVDGRPG